MKLIMWAQKDNGFFWNMKLEDDANLVALFWCDSLMKEDFRIQEMLSFLIKHKQIQLDMFTNSWIK